jgi:transposase-like zinc ribbon protein
MGKVFEKAWAKTGEAEDDYNYGEKKVNLFEKKIRQFEKVSSQFEKKFPDEEACRDYLLAYRWPKGYRCPKCGCKKYYLYKRKLYECKKCRYQVSLTAGTLFHRTRIPLKKWFLMIYCLNSENKIKLTTIKHFWPRYYYKTIWVMAQKIKKAMKKPNTKDMIEGIGPIKSVKLKKLKKGPIQLFLKRKL